MGGGRLGEVFSVSHIDAHYSGGQEHTLLCNVKALRSIGVIEPASEELAKHWIIAAECGGVHNWGFDSADGQLGGDSRLLDALGFNMPSSKIIL